MNILKINLAELIQIILIKTFSLKAWYSKLNDLKTTCEHVVSIMLHILRRTYGLFCFYLVV